MQIHDSELFSVLIPTFNGTPYLKRTLDYFRRVAYAGRIVLSDNSSGEHRAFIASCADAYDDLWIEAFEFAEDIRFLDKMVATLEQVDSRLVMLHAYDDFMVPAAVERCVGFLDRHPDFTAARGRVAMFALARGGASSPGQVSVSLVSHPMRGYEQEIPVERMLAHTERYASTFYSVHRRENLIESFRLTEAATKNVIFFQYLSSCISALQGKIHCLDELFYIRQGHADSWSGSLKQGSYEHWPLLITAPDFSRYYQEFRASLCGLVQLKFGVSPDAIGPRLDAAAVSLFRRGYCGQEFDNPEEVCFMRRLNDAGSAENRLLTAAVDFCVKYAETY